MSIQDHPIPVMPSILMRLLDEVGRTRALADEETDLVELIVTRGHQTRSIRFQWTPQLERALLRASHRKGSIKDFAAKHGITEKACYCRLDKMRSRKAELQRDGGKG